MNYIFLYTYNNYHKNLLIKYLLNNHYLHLFYEVKKIFRDIASEVLEDKVSSKKKLGFPVPIRDWMREEDVYSEIKHSFLSQNAKKFFKEKYLLKLLDQHKNNKKDNYRKVWTVYIFLKWYEEFFD